MMGKEKKARRHQSLAQQILEADAPRVTQRVKSKPAPGDAGAEFVEGSLSHKILEQARAQQAELEEEYGMGQSVRMPNKKKPSVRTRSLKGAKLSLSTQPAADSDDGGSIDSDSDQEFLCNEQEGCCPTVNDKDEKAMALFMNPEPTPRQTLATMIWEKIQDKATELGTQVSGVDSLNTHMDAKMVEVFNGVGTILSKYRSGKLPKAFKVIPSLSNWEEVLYLTSPDTWTASAMFQATRIFASNLNTVKAQRFFNLLLLPRVRDDIAEYKQLNFHLYMALRKSLFKPAAFFKGILLPLCESGTCTLREALIIGSVLAKTSVPMLHSSAALLKMAEMDYTGAVSIFIRTLLDKKYALPYRVVDSVVFHFTRFTSDLRELPVLWHQSLLTFVQRYKEDMSVEQKEALMELVRTKTHRDITPEVRREIVNSKCRDVGQMFISRTQSSDNAMQIDQ